LPENAHRSPRVGHGVLEARRGRVGTDLDDRIEHQHGPGEVVAGGGGELPARAGGHARRREAEGLARDLSGVLAHDERALVEGTLEPEQGAQQRRAAPGTGAPSTRVKMRARRVRNVESASWCGSWPWAVRMMNVSTPACSQSPSRSFIQRCSVLRRTAALPGNERRVAVLTPYSMVGARRISNAAERS